MDTRIYNIAQDLGFMVKRTCDANAFFYLVDANGFDVRNGKGEKLCVEIGECINPGGPNALPELWLRHGWIKERLASWWSIDTYVTDSKNRCFMAYNPQTTINGRRSLLNFNWVLAATPANFRRILEEVKRQFFNN